MVACRRIAVVGAGWAGLAAAVEIVSRGHEVSLFEMARHPGGRARQVDTRMGTLDNGQHVLVGACTQTLALMRKVGADPDLLLERQPLHLTFPDGRGLALRPGHPVLAFARAVLGHRDWSPSDRIRLLAMTGAWFLRGFRCPEAMTVDVLCRRAPIAIRREFLDPLCISALNTRPDRASAQAFLRVLGDALFSGPGGADLLVPRTTLSHLLPEPAWAWLTREGATLRAGSRVTSIEKAGPNWSVDGQAFDGVVLACTAVEAARLASGLAPGWSAIAAGLTYEPIVTAYLQDPRLTLTPSMIALETRDDAPAQFVFDLGPLGSAGHTFAFVVSAAGAWSERGLPATRDAILQQARRAFPACFLDAEAVLHVASDPRATFACVPGLKRPQATIAPALVAAGDYVAGPYPSTLEGAVRSGQSAATLVLSQGLDGDTRKQLFHPSSQY